MRGVKEWQKRTSRERGQRIEGEEREEGEEKKKRSRVFITRQQDGIGLGNIPS
jgi:hypothetical protein